MKKTLLLPVFAVLSLVFGLNSASAQAPCTPSMAYSVPGIYPSDTIPTGFVGQSYSTVVHFVFPIDTIIFGQTLNFDSFVVASVTGLPSYVGWQCDQFMNNCSYVTNPPNLTRGCVAVTSNNVTMTNPSYPAYDSALVVGEGWVTVPFVGPISAPTTIPIFYKFEPANSIDYGLASNLDLTVAPNPSSYKAAINYRLVEIADVKVSVHDVYGKEVAVVRNENLAPGEYKEELSVEDFPAGVYFVRVELNDGEIVKAKKLITVR